MKKLYLLLLLLLMGCNNETKNSDASIDEDLSLERVKQAKVLRWGADVIGGIPYVYEDPNKSGEYIGFEMDIAKGIARYLNVKQELVIKAWDTLIPELQRNSFDMAMNGIENTDQRSNIVLFSIPYYVYTQKITVRKTNTDIVSLEDMKGKTVATLSGTAAEDILRGIPGIKVSINPEIIYSYSDLESGKVDAVLLDTPIAVVYGAGNPNLKNVGESFGNGYYVIAFRSEDNQLSSAVNEALTSMKSSGELSEIYKKWGIMNFHQNKLGIN